MWLIFFLIFGLILLGIWEFRLHQFNLRQLPVRVQINGTRGKSSVTRLIAGGLRGGGLKVFAKTTGTKPRIIFPDGSEKPVVRFGKPNIIEQRRIVSKAVHEKVDYFVTECMGVQPHLQEILEKQLIKSTVGVITNVRADHMDVMGPTIDDVALSLANTVPFNGTIFTAEKDHYEIFRNISEIRKSKIIKTESSTVSDSEMRDFSYIEHKENVALALAVCEHLGVNREHAIKGMQIAIPDPGVLRRFVITTHGKTIEFVNAFAANDPDSYKVIWDMLGIHRESGKTVIILVNSRQDRIQRAEQLGEFIASNLTADFYVITGQMTHPLVTKAINCGLPHNKIENLGGRPLESIFNSIVNLSGEKSLVFGIGNIVGFGEQIVEYFQQRGSEIV